MVVIGKKFGRLANRLWIFSFFAANAMHYGHKLLNRNFDHYSPFFEASSRNDFGPYPIRARFSRYAIIDLPAYWLMLVSIAILKKLPDEGFFYKVIRAPRTDEGFNLNQPSFLQAASSKLVVSLDGGFWFKDLDNLKKYAPQLRQFFRPVPKYQSQVDELLDLCRTQADVLIGVHMRKGDYRKFREGMFYLENQVYYEKMQSVAEQLGRQQKSSIFLVCSDEPLNETDFPDLQLIKGDGHLIIDLYTLAGCDYLMGPPSTFSLWASFYGSVPLKFLHIGSMEVHLDSFRIAEGINEFQQITGY